MGLGPAVPQWLHQGNIVNVNSEGLVFSFFPSQFASQFFFDSSKCAWGLNKDKYKLQK